MDRQSPQFTANSDLGRNGWRSVGATCFCAFSACAQTLPWPRDGVVQQGANANVMPWHVGRGGVEMAEGQDSWGCGMMRCKRMRAGRIEWLVEGGGVGMYTGVQS